ncbi:MAG TPA: hypothetical protein VIV12_25010, partial [Streptosporangiaceae bacterium]
MGGKRPGGRDTTNITSGPRPAVGRPRPRTTPGRLEAEARALRCRLGRHVLRVEHGAEIAAGVRRVYQAGGARVLLSS